MTLIYPCRSRVTSNAASGSKKCPTILRSFSRVDCLELIRKPVCVRESWVSTLQWKGYESPERGKEKIAIGRTRVVKLWSTELSGGTISARPITIPPWCTRILPIPTERIYRSNTAKTQQRIQTICIRTINSQDTGNVLATRSCRSTKVTRHPSSLIFCLLSTTQKQA